MKYLVLLALLPSLAFGQAYTVKASCLPSVDSRSTLSSQPWLRWNAVGICISWNCYATATTPASGVTYCGTWTEQSKVGSRIQTIRKAADPLKSLQDAGKRFPMVPLTDPSMAGMPIP